MKMMLRWTFVVLVLASSGCDCGGSDLGGGDGGRRARRDAGGGGGVDSGGGGGIDSGGGGGVDSGGGSGPDAGMEDCTGIAAVVRDFDESHPDFEDDIPGLVTGRSFNDASIVVPG